MVLGLLISVMLGASDVSVTVAPGVICVERARVVTRLEQTGLRVTERSERLAVSVELVGANVRVRGVKRGGAVLERSLQAKVDDCAAIERVIVALIHSWSQTIPTATADAKSVDGRAAGEASTSTRTTDGNRVDAKAVGEGSTSTRTTDDNGVDTKAVGEGSLSASSTDATAVNAGSAAGRTTPVDAKAAAANASAKTGPSTEGGKSAISSTGARTSTTAEGGKPAVASTGAKTEDAKAAPANADAKTGSATENGRAAVATADAKTSSMTGDANADAQQRNTDGTPAGATADVKPDTTTVDSNPRGELRTADAKTADGTAVGEVNGSAKTDVETGDGKAVGEENMSFKPPDANNGDRKAVGEGNVSTKPPDANQGDRKAVGEGSMSPDAPKLAARSDGASSGTSLEIGAFGGASIGPTASFTGRGQASVTLAFHRLGFSLDAGFDSARERSLGTVSVSSTTQWASLNALLYFHPLDRLRLELSLGARLWRITATTTGADENGTLAFVSAGPIAAGHLTWRIAGPLSFHATFFTSARYRAERFNVTNLGAVLELLPWEFGLLGGLQLDAAL